MQVLTDRILINLNPILAVKCAIEKSDIDTWAFITDEGINNWANGTTADNSCVFDSFEKCLRALKKYEENSMKEINYELRSLDGSVYDKYYKGYEIRNKPSATDCKHYQIFDTFGQILAPCSNPTEGVQFINETIQKRRNNPI